jgi:hypothetical protein
MNHKIVKWKKERMAAGELNIPKSTKSFRMPYETYSYLKSLIEVQMATVEKEFNIACRFIPPETPKGDKLTGLGKAHKIFAREYSTLDRMKEDLHAASQETYKDHPNPEMRKFWGLEH